MESDCESEVKANHFWEDTRFDVLRRVPLSVDREVRILVIVILDRRLLVEVFIVNEKARRLRLFVGISVLGHSFINHEAGGLNVLRCLDSGSKFPRLGLSVIDREVVPHFTSVCKVVSRIHTSQKSNHSDLAPVLATEDYDVIVTIIKLGQRGDLHFT